MQECCRRDYIIGRIACVHTFTFKRTESHFFLSGCGIESCVFFSEAKYIKQDIRDTLQKTNSLLSSEIQVGTAPNENRKR